MRTVVVLSVLGAWACGSSEQPAEPGAPAAPAQGEPAAQGALASAEPTPAEAPASSAPASSAPAPSAPPDDIDETELVDLLRAVRVDVATSSAYQDRESQVRALVDDDLQTAWNSRTGDLEGAWIEVRIPSDARVFSMSMTAGFTRDGGETDLFTGNHRVSRVRVLRDGAELATVDLDVESRAAQVLDDVEGPGGVYRIELVALTPGTNPRWREACVSELRILGHAPSALEGERTPRVAVGALPPPYVPPAADREAIARAHARTTQSIATAFADALLASAAADDGSRDLTESDVEDLRRERRAALTRAADYVEPVDADRAAGLRARASRAVAWTDLGVRRQTFAGDLDALGVALEAVGVWLGDDAARCRWARLHAGLRLDRVATYMRGAAPHLDEGAPAARWGEVADTLAELQEAWGRNARGAAPRIERVRRLDAPGVAPDWDALLAQVALARTTCGW